jgi:hypothetical protein
MCGRKQGYAVKCTCCLLFYSKLEKNQVFLENGNEGECEYSKKFLRTQRYMPWVHADRAPNLLHWVEYCIRLSSYWCVVPSPSWYHVPMSCTECFLVPCTDVLYWVFLGIMYRCVVLSTSWYHVPMCCTESLVPCTDVLYWVLGTMYRCVVLSPSWYHVPMSCTESFLVPCTDVLYWVLGTMYRVEFVLHVLFLY